MKLATCMWLPKPMTLSRIVFLKPRTTLTDIIITASPIATPIVAMRIAGRDTFFLSSLVPYILCERNNGKFTFRVLLIILFQGTPQVPFLKRQVPSRGLPFSVRRLYALDLFQLQV